MKKSDWNTIKTVIDKILDAPEEEQIDLLEDTQLKYPELKDEIFSHYKNIKNSTEFWNQAFDASNKLIVDSIDLEHIGAIPLIEYKKGSRVGAYVLDEQIGRGGMGMVFKAFRADGQFERTVAIKLMALNIQFDEIRIRFLREQQILASLNHVNVAQFFDAGVTAIGNPYLVMEFVEGQEILDYINEKNLTVTEILALFQEVCKAVEYAHRNLIVHRDLKPSNILVSNDGILKVLDFGIAKLLGESMDEIDVVVTGNQQKLYSLAFASPEQIRGDIISTSSDIYSLGLLLFQMLTQEKPHNLEGLSRAAAEKLLIDAPILDITKTKSSLSREADLSAIVQKCVRKEPDSRYRSVSELIIDLTNYEQNKPVSAHKGSTVYKVQKFWKRNRISTSITAMFLLSAILFSVFYTIRINKERLIAERESQKARLVTDYLVNLFEQADPINGEEKDQTIADFITKSIENLSELDNEPELQQEAAFTLGRVTSNLGSYQDAEMLLQKSLLLASENETEPKVLASIYFSLGQLGSETGHFRKAIGYYTSAKQLLATGDKNPESLAFKVERSLAVSNAHLGNIDEAEEMMAALLSRIEFDSEKISLETIQVLANLADISREKNDYESSIDLENQVIFYLENQIQDNDHLLMAAYNNLGVSFRNLSQYDQALINYKKTLELAESLMGYSHPNTLTTLNNMAVVYSNLEQYEQVLEIRNDQLSRTISQYGDIHWRTASAYGSVAEAEIDLALPRALETMNTSISLFNEVLGENHFWTLRQQIRKSFIQYQLGNEEQASELITQAINQLIQTVDDPLAYYDKSGLLALGDAFNQKGYAIGHQEINRFFEWYSKTIE